MPWPAVGSGEAGFDYTKISNSGQPLVASAALGSGTDDWGCTRDNVTKLVWEVKVNSPSHLRHMNHTYTWFSADASVNCGVPGSLGTATTCNSTLVQCNTRAFVAAVNAQGLCGHSDWRMPTPEELQGLAHYGRFNPAIDLVFFINIGNPVGRTDRSAAISPANAWVVNFYDGGVSYRGYTKDSGFVVRLVRAEQ